jgi:hypothetical protein
MEFRSASAADVDVVLALLAFDPEALEARYRYVRNASQA